MGTDARDRQGREGLREELRGVAIRRLPEVFKNPDGRDEVLFPLLARISATVLPEVWGEDPTRALIQLMRVVVGSLPDGNPKDCAISWGSLAALLYGFRRDLPLKVDGTPYSYNDYILVAKRECDYQLDSRTWNRQVTHPLRLKLVSKLLELEDDTVSGDRLETPIDSRNIDVLEGGDNSSRGVSPLRSLVQSPNGGELSESRHDSGGERSLVRTVNAEMGKVIDGLSHDVRRRLQNDRRQRKVSDPFPLPLRWGNLMQEEYVDHWENIHGNGSQCNPIDLAGSLVDVLKVFKSVPSGRLVILGSGGSGKSTLVTELALELLTPDGYLAADQVPFVFQMATWDPTRKSLQDWMAEQLVLESGLIRVASRGAGMSAVDIVQGGHIIPILDGLDEMAPSLRSSAMRALNVSLNYGDRMILTSREREYCDTVASSDVLTYAPVVVIERLKINDIVEYLPLTARRLRKDRAPGSEVSRRTKWDRPLASMQSPDEVRGLMLLELFSTPLMVSLARAIYSDTVADPEELLDVERFPDLSSLSDNLLDKFIDVAYESDIRNSPKESRLWRADLARDGLSWLAVRLHDQQSRSIAWWRIDRRPSRGFSAYLLFSIMVAASVAYWSLISVDDFSAAVIALGCYLVAYGINDGTHRKPTTLSRLRLRLRLSELRRLRHPERGFYFMLCGFPVGQLVVIFRYGFDWLQIAEMMLPFLWLLFVAIVEFRTPVDALRVVSPGVLMRSDFRAAVVKSLLCAAGLLLFARVFAGVAIDYNLIIGMMLVVAGLILASGSGSWKFRRLCRAASGTLPWRALDFFDDAVRRGVLRQVGGFYQFRHALLQDRLAYNFIVLREQRGNLNASEMRAKKNLSVEWLSSGRIDEAVAALHVVLVRQRSQLGAEHLETVRTWLEWVIALQVKRQFSQVLAELKLIREVQRRALRPAAPLSVKISHFHAWCLVRDGKIQEGVEEYVYLLGVLKSAGKDSGVFSDEVRESLTSARAKLL